MTTNRREFIKSAGSAVATLGIGTSIAFQGCKTIREKNNNFTTDNQPSVQVSEKGAIVETISGKVRGYIRGGIYTYKGIPYGASTAGSNRFMSPGPPDPWSGIRNALYWGPASPQQQLPRESAGNDFDLFCNPFTYHWGVKYFSEDCLRINIWTPSIDDNNKRPVLVWFHGGGFTGGSSNELDAYVGENLSRRGDVVVCSVNHRLGPFGFLNLSGAGGERFAASQNVGVLDLVRSLEWVRDNIASFGGDRDNVTIIGQSGGGGKVNTLMAMPSAMGLFHKAVNMSGPVLRVAEKETSAKIGHRVLKEANLSPGQIEKLQYMPWEKCFDLINTAVRKESEESKSPRATRRYWWSPTADGVFLPDHPFDPVAPVISKNIPMIIGTCMNEFSPSANNPAVEDIPVEELVEKLKSNFGQHTQQVVEAYLECFPDKKPVEIWSMIGNDRRTKAVLQAERQTANGGAVFNYWFGWQTPLFDGRPRSYHNSDIPFWFDNTELMDTITGGGERPKKLGVRMSQALINFCRTGNPDHGDLPEWPCFTKEKGAVMIFNDVCEVKNDPDRQARKVLNECSNG
jgi:para-nitrobenzyl esterase